MKIRKFNEADTQDISSERVDEIKEKMTEMTTDLNQKLEYIDSIINELNKNNNLY